MLKRLVRWRRGIRWRPAAWRRGTRWLAGGAAIAVAGLAIAWLLFALVADWLASHDVGSATGPLHETAVDNARGRLLALGAGVFAAGALVFTARNFTLSRRTLELSAQGQVTDRYTKAIEQLGSDKLDVRIGGIYALERIARDSARDHPTVMEVLTAFIRTYSHAQWPPPGPDGAAPARSTRPDVQAAVTVVGRRDATRDIRPIYLTDSDLAGADLHSADLSGAYLIRANLGAAYLDDARLADAKLANAKLADAVLLGADLTGADLSNADLTGTVLTRADLSSATLHNARLTEAQLGDATLTGTFFVGADLGSAYLGTAKLDGAVLTGACLAEAKLRGADLGTADLTGADLTGADLRGTDLTGTALGGADMGGARWPEDAPVPEGWALDAGSGRLKRAGTGDLPAEAE